MKKIFALVLVSCTSAAPSEEFALAPVNVKPTTLADLTDRCEANALPDATCIWAGAHVCGCCFPRDRSCDPCAEAPSTDVYECKAIANLDCADVCGSESAPAPEPAPEPEPEPEPTPDPIDVCAAAGAQACVCCRGNVACDAEATAALIPESKCSTMAAAGCNDSGWVYNCRYLGLR